MFTISIIAMAEVARPLRFINVVFGAWLVIVPWILDGAGGKWAVVNSLLSGSLSLPRSQFAAITAAGTGLSSDRKKARAVAFFNASPVAASGHC